MLRTLITVVLLLVVGPVLNFFILPRSMETVFLDVFAAPGLDLQQFLSEGPPKLFKVFWFCNMGAIIVWFYRTMGRRAASAARVAAMRTQWWTAAGLLVAAGLICSAFSIWFPFPRVSLLGDVLLLALLLVDEALLFWLPTVLASPRSYRLVAPGAQLFQGN